MNVLNIVEGFDYVGKSALIDKILNDKNPYHPDYRTFDKYYNRNLAFMFGYAQIDLINNLPEDKELDVTIDRALFSSWVYSRLYGDESQWLPDEMLHDYIKKLNHEKNVSTVYHVFHKDKSSAKRIYENDKSHNDILDHFDSFDDYWKYYRLAEELYDTCYRVHKVSPVKYATISNENGSRVELVRI